MARSGSATTNACTPRQTRPSERLRTAVSVRPRRAPPRARPATTAAPATSRNTSGSPMPLLHDAVLERDGDGAGAVGDAELGEDPLQVGLDRLRRDVERLGHLPVGGAVGDHLEHLDLPARQRRHALLAPGELADLLDE